jgi:hypothetical protein
MESPLRQPPDIPVAQACAACGNPISTKRARCYRCNPGGRRKTNHDKFIRAEAILRDASIRIKRPPPNVNIEGHWSVREGTRQSEELELRRSEDRAAIPKAARGTEREREFWAQLASAARHKAQERMQDERRLPGTGIR